MGQRLSNAKLLCYDGPVFFKSFELSDKIGQNFPVGIYEPVELISMRRRMNTRAAAVLDPIDKFIKRHFVSHLFGFGAFIKRDDAVPRITHKPKLKVSCELPLPDFDPAWLGDCEIQTLQDAILSSASLCPITFHQPFVFP